MSVANNKMLNNIVVQVINNTTLYNIINCLLLRKITINYTQKLYINIQKFHKLTPKVFYIVKVYKGKQTYIEYFTDYLIQI